MWITDKTHPITLRCNFETNLLSTTVSNDELIRLNRFVSRCTTHPNKSFINRLHLVLLNAKISFPKILENGTKHGLSVTWSLLPSGFEAGLWILFWLPNTTTDTSFGGIVLDSASNITSLTWPCIYLSDSLTTVSSTSQAVFRCFAKKNSALQ